MIDVDKRIKDLYALMKKVYKFENDFDLPTIEIHTKLINGKVFYYLFVMRDGERETESELFYKHSTDLNDLFELNTKYFERFLEK